MNKSDRKEFTELRIDVIKIDGKTEGLKKSIDNLSVLVKVIGTAIILGMVSNFFTNYNKSEAGSKHQHKQEIAQAQVNKHD